jgi:hypothetical protein
MDSKLAHVYRWFRCLLEFTIPLKKVDDLAYLRGIVRLQLHSRPPLSDLGREATFFDTDRALVELTTAVLRRADSDLGDVPKDVAGRWIARELLGPELGLVASGMAERLDPNAIGIRAAAGYTPSSPSVRTLAPRVDASTLAFNTLDEILKSLPGADDVSRAHVGAVLRAGSRKTRAMLARMDTPLQHAWLGMVTARARHLQGEGIGTGDLDPLFPGLTAFSREYQPGWVAGLKRGGGPTKGATWVLEAEYWGDVVARQLAAMRPEDLMVASDEVSFRPLSRLSQLLEGAGTTPDEQEASTIAAGAEAVATSEPEPCDFVRPAASDGDTHVPSSLPEDQASDVKEAESVEHDDSQPVRVSAEDRAVAVASAETLACDEEEVGSTWDVETPDGRSLTTHVAAGEGDAGVDLARPAPDDARVLDVEEAWEDAFDEPTRLAVMFGEHVFAKERRSLELAQLAFREAEDAIGEILESVPRPDAVSRTIHRVSAALQASGALPSELAAIRARAESSPNPSDVDRKIEGLGLGAANPMLEGVELAYDGLLEALRLVEDCRDDALIPSWLVEHATKESDPVQVFLVLAGDPVARASLCDCAGWIGELAPEAAALLGEPITDVVAPTRSGLAEELERRTHRLEEREESESRVAEFFDGEYLDRAAEELDEDALILELVTLLKDYEDVAEAVSGAGLPIGTELERVVRTRGLGARHELELARDAVAVSGRNRILQLALSAVSSMQQLEEILHDVLEENTFTGSLDSESGYVLQLTHATSGTRALVTPRVSYVPAESVRGSGPEAGLGYVELPVRVTISPPPTRALQLHFSCPQLTGRVPGDLLAERSVVPVSRLDNAVDEWEQEVVLNLPATQVFDPTRPGAAKELELSCVLLETDGVALAEAPRSVHYRDIVHADQAVSAYLNPLQRDRVEPGEVWEHPIGVQRGIVKVRDHIRRQQQSFFAAAPRRFGKTMMIRALEYQLADDDEVVVFSVTASTDRIRFWADVEAALGDHFACSASHVVGARQQALPLRGEGCTFELVRRKAAEQGIRTIWFLVDEAQRLFAGGDSMDFGDSFKDQLDVDLTRSSPDSGAIRFGFFGLSHLRTRMGANFRGALADWSVSEIQPADLEKLLRTDSKEGLQTSKRARRQLARQAENFWILRELLMVAEDYLKRKRRTWLIEPDIHQLVDELFDNEDKRVDVWNYVRDPLNDHEDTNYWQPSPAYPVALALSAALSRGLKGRDVRPEVDRILEIWAGKTVLEREVGRQINDLQARNLLQADSLAFRTELTRRVLARRAGVGPSASEPAIHELLDRLTVGTLDVPDRDDLVRLGGGRQAEVMLGRDDLVYRLEMLADLGSRKSFLKTCEVYRRLKDSLAESGDVRDHFPQILRWGFTRSKGGDEGVLVYRFVPGTPLTGGCLKPPAAAWAGYCLARAVHHLSKVDIIHRDLKPENILFQAGGNAAGKLVLVDFGLSRVVDLAVSPTTTNGASAGYLPPEVATEGPAAWSSVGDLYSLGQTLSVVLDSSNGVPSGLIQAIEQLRSSSPAQRGTPAGAEELFQELLGDQDLRVLQARDEAEERYLEMLIGLPPGVGEVASKFKENFIAVQLGVVLGWERRMMDTALLLNDLFESYVEQRLGPARREGNSLAAARHLCTEDTAFVPFDNREARLVGLVRLAAAHHDWRSKFDEAMVLVDGDGEQIGEAMYAVADALDAALDGTGTDVRELTHAFLK